MQIKNWVNNLLDYIWPKFCLSCQTEGALLCQQCLDSIPLQSIDYQAWPTSNFTFQRCYVCLDYHWPLTQKLIKTFKYKYFSQLDQDLVYILAKFAKQLSLSSQTIITNPSLHHRRKQKRGFDQTELLARGLAKVLQLPYYPLLIRKKFTKAQAELNREQRLDNIKGAFTINPKLNLDNIDKKQTILIIDDVVTTGSTLEQAAITLSEAGFYNIICLVLAKN